jgi:phosphate transport system protein
MYCREFEGGLRLLERGVGDLATEVGRSLEAAVTCLEDGDAGAAGQRAGVDLRYKALGARIEADSMILQARYAPVARDLRRLHAVRLTAEHLVRAGSLCEHVCRAVCEISDAADRDAETAASLLSMARAASGVLRGGVEALEARDVDRAKRLAIEDDRVDRLREEVMGRICGPDRPDGADPACKMRTALVAHYLERIADHGVQIGEGAVFLVTGERAVSIAS